MEAMKRLEDMTSRENDASATGAAETVAYFHLKIIHDPDAAAKSFHRVVTLDPQNETAWDMLTICWGMADNDEQSKTVSKQRLKHKESAHNHFMLAKAYERSNQLEQAEEEVRGALKLEPHDFLANLSLACLLLKRADNSKLLAEAKRYLDNAQAQSEHSSPAEKSDYAAARGLYFVLTGNTEEGKRQFQQSLKFDPENDQATRALEILKDD